MPLYPHVNRAAVIVRPRPAFVTWINGVERTLHPRNPMVLTLEQVDRDANVYLIPESVLDLDPEPVLCECWDDIFENELAGWFEDESTWPHPRTRQLFDEFFLVSFHSQVSDLGDEPLVSDDSDVDHH